MTQQVPEVFDDLPEGGSDRLTQEIFEKKQNKLLNSDKFSIKKFNNGVLEDAYDGIFDFSEEDSKKNFEVLKKVIAANNWYVISDNAIQQYNNNECSIDDLEKLTKISHDSLGLNFIAFPQKEIKNSFIDNAEEFKSVYQEPSKPSNPTEPIATEPKYIVSNLDITVRSKLNELNYRRDLVKKSGGISLKTVVACGGVLALGAVISPLSAITVPVATVIGIYAVAKAFLSKDPEVKNFDKQIDLLKTATKNLSKKSNLTNDDFKAILFGEPIEQEFARLCSRNNVQIDRVIFPKGHLHLNSDIDDLNKATLKKKMR